MASKQVKEVNDLVNDSHKDIDDMQANLSKLKSLSADDKTENAILRSRIDEQSQLIMILKQRADQAVGKMKTIERINTELMEFRENAKDKLETEIRKHNMIDKRFGELAENHEEMIKIKNDYKKQNEDLRNENKRLSDENSRLFSDALSEKDAKLADLGKKFEDMKAKNGEWETNFKYVLGRVISLHEICDLNYNIAKFIY